MEVDRHSRGRLVFRPFSILYFLILLIWLMMVAPFAFLFLRGLLVRGLGLPPEMVFGLLLLSLFGSFVNIPLTQLKSRAPVYTYREITFFGVTWYVPRVDVGTRRTLITLNIGGGLVPLLISSYVLLWAIPRGDPGPLFAYGKIAVVLSVVTVVVNRTSRLVEGLGVATPAFVPPAITALATFLVYGVGTPSSPAHIAYVGGTLGTLVGADLLNIRHLPRLGAPVVSIGGAGTFDGIYTTGLVSVLLVLLLL